MWGKRPLQGIRALVRMAISRSRGLWMIRPSHHAHGVAAQSHAHAQRLLAAGAAALEAAGPDETPRAGRKPRSSSKVKSGKKIAMGGSITETTQLVTRYTPDTSASVSHWGAPAPSSQAERRGSKPDSVSLSQAEGTLAPDRVRYSTTPSSASMSGMPICRRASSRSMRS